MKNWRKVHRFSFGYLKLTSIFIAAVMVCIAVTGILYNHQHDLACLRDGRIHSGILPGKYQEKLDRVREAQGLGELFPEEADRVPVMWVIIDLHTGDFFGPWGRWFYDIIAVMFVVLAVTGIYMYLKIRKKSRF